jgi:integrase
MVNGEGNVGFASERIFGNIVSKDNSVKATDSNSQIPTCPNCGPKTKKVWRAGTYQSILGDVIQRWLCCQCGLRFSDPDDAALAKERLQQEFTFEANTLKNSDALFFFCQISAWKAKNLEPTTTCTEKVGISLQENKGQIIELAWWMQKEGYAEATINRRARLLKTLINKGADIQDSESVKETIAKQQHWKNKTKKLAVETYDCYLKMHGQTWKKPIFNTVRTIPFIPTEEELNCLIAGCNKTTATFLQLLKETGIRSGEAFMLQWIDINTEKQFVNITPEKGSEPRQIKISKQLITMLNSLPHDNTKPFAYSQRHFARNFRTQRKRITHKLKNARLLKIHFHTLRHWKATTEYHKTKNILHVMKLLGHKNIQNTLLYTQLINFDEDDNFHSATAKTIQEAQKLVEAGFEYVCAFEEVKLFRKRK